ncbi:MAG TPA: T9SS type A sorting domain-containing protein [Panacibacter sp.]|nr:T9SS type A sorting domain-containing protein [Panacibacter sp.]
MKFKKTSLALILAVSMLFVYAQVPVIKWQNTIGGTGNDSLVSIMPTADGGFIISGQSNSNISGSKTQNSYGSYDYWVVKITGKGKIAWNKTIGGSGIDKNPYIITTLDGGYLLGGTSISDISGNKTEDAINQSNDYWVLKLDRNGNVQWNNTIGAIQTEKLAGLVQEKDSTYRIAGISYTNFAGSDKTADNMGSSIWSDYWLVKLDKNGVVAGDYLYGGQNSDVVTCIKPAKDSGYILGGYSYSKKDGNKSQNFLGNNDYWIVRIDPSGNKKWDKTIGGIRSDYETDIQQTFDRGYILAGYSNSTVSFNKTAGWKGVTDYWLVKTDSVGAVKWDKTFGGTLGDYLRSVQQTTDSGYIIGGSSNSNISSDKSENSKGLDDYWIMKLDKNGNKLWDKTIGGSGNDRLSVVKEISNGEYILAGTSNSTASGDKTKKTVGNNGISDYWIVRLTSSPSAKNREKRTSQESPAATAVQLNIEKLTMQASPNPAKEYVTITYSGMQDKKISLMVYDSNGKTILNKVLETGKNIFTFNISQQPAGVYYVVITSGKSSVTRIIVKE